MLAPDARSVLLELLRPPAGCELDAAVATTFTLDLTAALTAPLAFASFALADTNDPLTVMESIRSVTDRVDIFCQAGQIGVPQQASDLVAYLEPMVHEVRRPRPGYLFHPKLWLLRFIDTDTGDPSYRLVVPTRNLTLDTSWDAVLSLDATRGTAPDACNKPLRDLLLALPDWSVQPLPAERRDRIEELAAEVRYLEWDLPDDVRWARFHVFGLPKDPRPTIDLRGQRHLVISPFLNDDGIAQATGEEETELTVVSRPEELDKLSPEVLAGIDARMLNPLAGLPPLDDEPGAGDGQGLLGGLHAKIYAIEWGNETRFIIGSANATGAAFGGNVEILVELGGKRATMGIDQYLGDHAPFAGLLDRYDAVGGATESAQEEAQRQLDNYLRALAEARFTLTVEPGDDGYRLALTVDGLSAPPDGLRATVELLTRRGDARVLPVADETPPFGPVALADISAFLVVHATLKAPGVTVDGSTVVRAALVGDPPDRLDEILARQVGTPDAFLRFLLLLLSLSGDPAAAALLAQTTGAGGAGDWGLSAAGVLELVVRALADRPAAIDDLARLVERLRATETGQSALPDGFDELWSAVLEARELIGEPVT